MIRDTRRFLWHQWTLLEIPARFGISLTAVWRDRYGCVPALTNGAASGWHFGVEDGMAVVFAKPHGIQLPDPSRARALALIRAKHRVDVRCATAEEIARVTPASRIPRIPHPSDVSAVEEYPCLVRRRSRS